AVAALLLLRAGHLGEGALLALRHEHRVVAEPARAARLLDQLALDPALGQLLVAVRPGKAEHRDERRAAIGLREAAEAPGQLVAHPGHGPAKVALRPGPARRVHPGRAIQTVRLQPRAVGARRQPARPPRGPRT